MSEIYEPTSSNRYQNDQNDHEDNQYKHHEPGLYEIRVKGHLDERWTAWFGGLTVMLEHSGNTLLTGSVADQAALHGLLRRVRDLGMPLISVVCVEPGRKDASDSKC